MVLFENVYHGENLCDLDRDVFEAIDPDFNSKMKEIPQDEHGFNLGRFRVTIVWENDNEAE